MSITYTLNNLSAESAESVDIAPYRTGWVEVENDSKNGDIREYRRVGDDIEYPAVLKLGNMDSSVYHPARSPKSAVSGRKFLASLASDISVDDSLAGRRGAIPVIATLGLAVGAPTIPDYANVLQLILSLTSMLYPSVTTGTPSSANMAILAAGGLGLLD
jgi:hypothetical protein